MSFSTFMSGEKFDKVPGAMDDCRICLVTWVARQSTWPHRDVCAINILLGCVPMAVGYQ